MVGLSIKISKYGLSYFLWPNTRPIDTYQRGVRTDDDTLLRLVLRITSALDDENKPLVCFDVGGFMGIVTLTMLKGINGNGIVHTFEPMRRPALASAFTARPDVKPACTATSSGVYASLRFRIAS